jgi:hypothetical protein
MFDGTRAPLDGTTILCIVVDDTSTHEILLTVQHGSLRALDRGADMTADDAEPTVTVTGSLPAWMDLLIHATAGHPTSPNGLTSTGNAATFDTLLHALH